MNRKYCAGLFFVCFFGPAPVLAQGLGEYGRLLGETGHKTTNVIPKTVVPKTDPRSSGKSQTPSLGNLPSDSMPTELIVESETTTLYSRSEDWSDKLMQLSRGEKLVPTMKAAGAQTVWYMVKLENGQSGWVKASDVGSTPTPKK